MVGLLTVERSGRWNCHGMPVARRLVRSVRVETAERLSLPMINRPPSELPLGDLDAAGPLRAGDLMAARHTKRCQHSDHGAIAAALHGDVDYSTPRTQQFAQLPQLLRTNSELEREQSVRLTTSGRFEHRGLGEGL